MLARDLLDCSFRLVAFREAEPEVVATRALLQGDDELADFLQVPAHRVLQRARALELTQVLLYLGAQRGERGSTEET